MHVLTRDAGPTSPDRPAVFRSGSIRLGA
jgi:hypothetical protein